MSDVLIPVEMAAAWTGEDQGRLIDLYQRGLLQGTEWGSPGQRRIMLSENEIGFWFKLPLPGPRSIEIERERLLREPAKKPSRRPPPPPPRDHWLYWFYDAADTLLYIGITNSGVKRMEQHGAEKLWWPQVARIAVDHFPTRAEAEAAEVAAIKANAPLHNGTHNQRKVSCPS